MEANELRLNNLVKTSQRDLECNYKVIAIGEEFVDLECIDRCDFLREINGVEIPSLHPIPLTEEWLVKFGFEVVKHVRSKIYLSEGWLEIETDFSYGIIPHEEAYSFGHWWSGKLKYVHELQNLYFAITGEELQIKQQ